MKKIGEIFFKMYLGFVLIWIGFALSFQLFFVYLELSGQTERAKYYHDEIAVRIDGTYKDNPKNIFYEPKTSN